jgi:hypothetical protein
MTKYYCDICGVEIIEYYYLYIERDLKSSEIKTYYNIDAMCNECRRTIQLFIGDMKKMNKKNWKL